MRLNPIAFVLPLVATLAHAPAALAFDDKTVDAVFAHAVDDYIRPTFNDLHSATANLVTTTKTVCDNPGQPEIKAMQDAFGSVVKAWSRAEIIAVGPVLKDDRLQRFNFYPDRKGLTLKQMQALLDKKDKDLLDPAKLGAKSVAIQGLNAYEQVFWGFYPEGVTGSKNTFQCQYGLAIAGNLDQMAAAMAAEWNAEDGIAADLKAPGKTNAEFQSDSESLKAILGFVVHGMEMWRERRVEQYWRGKDQKPKPKMAIFWRSGMTQLALTANLEGMRDLWTKAGLETLLDEDVRSISGSIVFDYSALIKTTAALDAPGETQLADAKYQAKLDYLLMISRDLLLRINDDYGKAVGLGAGFSFSDGD